MNNVDTRMSTSAFSLSAGRGESIALITTLGALLSLLALSMLATVDDIGTPDSETCPHGVLKIYRCSICDGPTR